jgi:hypothetical protein
MTSTRMRFNKPKNDKLVNVTWTVCFNTEENCMEVKKDFCGQ